MCNIKTIITQRRLPTFDSGRDACDSSRAGSSLWAVAWPSARGSRYKTLGDSEAAGGAGGEAEAAQLPPEPLRDGLLDVIAREVRDPAGVHQLLGRPQERQLRHRVLVKLRPRHLLVGLEHRHVHLVPSQACYSIIIKMGRG